MAGMLGGMLHRRIQTHAGGRPMRTTACACMGHADPHLDVAGNGFKHAAHLARQANERRHVVHVQARHNVALRISGRSKQAEGGRGPGR